MFKSGNLRPRLTHPSPLSSRPSSLISPRSGGYPWWNHGVQHAADCKPGVGSRCVPRRNHTHPSPPFFPPSLPHPPRAVRCPRVHFFSQRDNEHFPPSPSRTHDANMTCRRTPSVVHPFQPIFMLFHRAEESFGNTQANLQLGVEANKANTFQDIGFGELGDAIEQGKEKKKRADVCFLSPAPEPLEPG